MTTLAQDLGGVVLAACPFCGNDVNDDEGCFQAGGFLLPTTPHWVVRCGNPSCNAETSAVNPDDAIAAWNTRTHSAEIAGALRDAERLDWMAHHGASLRNEPGQGWFVLAPYHTGIPSVDGRIRFPTARTAIDSAMQQGGGGGDHG